MRTIFLSLVFLNCITNCFSQENSEYCYLFEKTIKLYNENAIYPINQDNFNINQFKNIFLITLDPNSTIFNSEDTEIFDLIQELVKKDLKSSYCSLQNDLVKRFKENIENSIVTLEKLKTQNLDFGKFDSLYIGFEAEERYKPEKEYRCKNYIKSIILQDELESIEIFDALSKSKSSLLLYIDSVKIKLINKEIEMLKELMNSSSKIQEVVYYAFINSLLVQYDLYSSAFSNEMFSVFKEELSTYSKKFGFQLETNNQGDIVIASILPGSYAWKTGLINPGDKVIKFETENRASINTDRSELNEILEYLANISTEKLTLTLLKADNTLKRVDLYRESYENIENSVQSFILNGENKVGYIILPAFYTSWDMQNAFGCAQDVGRAIYSLKKENIESLIIDLRDNAGGSIKEAIELAGIFIDFGTLSFSRNKNNELSSIKDFNRGTFYSGTMAILVNNNSASASEMVAAVLQDYNRAIIIGDTTFGKATGQLLLPVNSDNKSVLKYTTNKYYRVTGYTYNNTGIIPDVILPGYNKRSGINSKSNHLSYISDSIEKKTYYVPLSPIPKKSLNINSQVRIANNIKFQKLLTIDSLYSTLSIWNGYLPLSFNSYYRLLEQTEIIHEQLDSLMSVKSKIFTIELLPKDKDLLKVYKYYSDLFNQISESILADPYIEETINILIDYNNLKNN